jgi:hypothetical protein
MAVKKNPAKAKGPKATVKDLKGGAGKTADKVKGGRARKAGDVADTLSAIGRR